MSVSVATRLTNLDGVPDQLLRLLPLELMRRYRCVPVVVYRGVLIVAAVRRLSRAASFAIAAACGLSTRVVRTEPGAILRTVGRAKRATVLSFSGRSDVARRPMATLLRRRPPAMRPTPLLPTNLAHRLRLVPVERGGETLIAHDTSTDPRDVELAVSLAGAAGGTLAVETVALDRLLAELPPHATPTPGPLQDLADFARELGYGDRVGDTREAGAIWDALRARRDTRSTDRPATTWELAVPVVGWRAQDAARTVITGRQKATGAVLMAALALAAALDPVTTGAGLVLLVSLLYLATTVYRAKLVLGGPGTETAVAERRLASVVDADLPVYTILIPLYREAVVVRNLLAAIDRFDYPHAKLDVKILLEEDDPETLVAIRSRGLPDYAEIIVVPHGVPTSKPRACNEGLRQARGAYAVIYDAEDIPETDQLRKALRMFRERGEAVGCVQCRLNYYNPRQNGLTRWFTAEYSQWFDLYLPALSAGKGPVPLGGTSNHFPTVLLQRLGGWDAFNVAEDADLGVRLHRAGYRTVVADSTTWEEATSQVPNWIRQRSRWIKGYAQTWLVHMRQPATLYRELGLAGFLSFQMTVGGTVFMLLANPAFWLLTLAWYLTRWGVIESLFPTPVYFAASITFFVGNAAFVYAAMLGAARRGYVDLVRWLLLLPVYWVLMSWAAWKGCLQLIYRPFYWEKTEHGHADVGALEGPAGAAMAGAGHAE